MAPVSDLAWTNINSVMVSAFGAGASVVQDSYGQISFTCPSDAKLGVVEFTTRLLQACKLAQDAANEGKPSGEKLVSFLSPVTGIPSNGYVPVTRSVISRYELISATNIVGSN